MRVIEYLVQGKTDTELLEAIVYALSDNDEDLIDKLSAATNYQNKAIANVEVAAAIVRAVRNRVAATSAESAAKSNS